MKKASIYLALLLSLPLSASNDFCEFKTEKELEAVLQRLGLTKNPRTVNDVFDEYFKSYTQESGLPYTFDNEDEILEMFQNELGFIEYDDELTPDFLSKYYLMTKDFDLVNVDQVLTKLSRTSLERPEKLKFSMSFARVDPSIIDSDLFGNIEIYSIDGAITEHYPHFRGKDFNSSLKWDDVNMSGGVTNRPEIVINNTLDFDEKSTLYSAASALDNTSLNSSLKIKFSKQESFKLAWEKDLAAGKIKEEQFQIASNMDEVFKELFYRVNKENPDISWSNLYRHYEDKIVPELSSAKPESKINYHGVPNYIDLAYDKMDPTDPIQREWLKAQGFIENDIIDDNFLADFGNDYLNLELTMPEQYKPKTYAEMNTLVSNSIKGLPDAQDAEVILWRGTSGDKAQNIAKYKTAGGDPRGSTAVGRPTENDADIQVSIGGYLPEYTNRLETLDQFSRGHYAVAIKIKLKYLRGASVSEEGWIAYKNAPVDVLLIIDRTNGLPEGPTTGNGS